jgi:hypothetical protein
MSTGVQRQQADIGSVLASSGEAVEDQARNPFVPCAAPSAYQPTRGVVLPPTWTAANVVIVPPIGHWDGAKFQSGSCSDLVTPPAAPTLTSQTSGGSLPPGTYSYRLVFDDGIGGTMPGPEAIPTLVVAGTTNLVTISWAAPPTGVTAVSVYGRTSGAEKFLGSTVVQSPPTADSFVDTGVAAPVMPLPATSGNLQLITITVSSPNGQASQSRSFVKRGP